MSKAYDRLEWSFIRAVFECLGFDEVWVNWIMQCVSTVSYSFLINDSALESVKPDRGIRQGDPLSPYIFILCWEVLSGLCHKAQLRGDITSISVARHSPRISHLLFADDTMFFLKANAANSTALHSILHDYELASGQLINTNKSSISFSAKTPQEMCISVKQTLGIAKEGGVGKYLGLPELFTRRKRDLFSSIVDRIKLKAASWSSRQLSPAGKLTMLKLVLSAIPTHSMSCFLLPVGLCNQIQSALTRFWWDSDPDTKKICWVSWDTLSRSKDDGGLGFRDIQAFNVAMLAKLAWHLITRPNCLLSCLLQGKYCHSKSFLSVACSTSSSHGWRSLLAGRDLLVRHLGKVIGNGNSTKVWSESWLSTSSHLPICGPPKEIDRDLVVADLLVRDSVQWNRQKIESILPSVAHLIYQIFPSSLNAEDRFCWQRTKSGIYSVRSGYYAMIDESPPAVIHHAFNWHKNVWSVKTTPKINLFLWRLVQGALPLGANLQARGLTANTNCPHCNAPETALHLILHCPYAQQVWELAPFKSTTVLVNSDSIQHALNLAPTLVCLPPKGITTELFSWLCWNLWTARNRLIFENRGTSHAAVVTNALVNVREWNQAQKIPSPPGPTPTTAPLYHAPLPPDISFCNSDASWSQQSL